jgi:hypothetical protein
VPDGRMHARPCCRNDQGCQRHSPDHVMRSASVTSRCGRALRRRRRSSVAVSLLRANGFQDVRTYSRATTSGPRPTLWRNYVNGGVRGGASQGRVLGSLQDPCPDVRGRPARTPGSLDGHAVTLGQPGVISSGASALVGGSEAQTGSMNSAGILVAPALTASRWLGESMSSAWSRDSSSNAARSSADRHVVS